MYLEYEISLCTDDVLYCVAIDDYHELIMQEVSAIISMSTT